MNQVRWRKKNCVQICKLIKKKYKKKKITKVNNTNPTKKIVTLNHLNEYYKLYYTNLVVIHMDKEKMLSKIKIKNIYIKYRKNIKRYS